MKLKTVEVGGKAYAEIADGKPVYVHDDGKETPFDAPHSLATIGRLNGEAKGHRERAEAAEGKIKAFEGIEDPEAARKALTTVKNLDAGSLVTAGKVDEIKAAAVKAAEEQVAAAAKSSATKIKELEGERNRFRDDLFAEKVGGSFSRSKLITEKFAIPADMVQARFGQSFKVEDGKIVAYDPSGNKMYSRSKPGDLADFDEALEMLVDAYPYRDQILKGANNSGSGSRQSNGSGNGAAGKTMTMAAFRALPPSQQATIMTGNDRPTLVD